MLQTPAQFTEMNKAQMDTLYALSHTMFEATEKLVDLNLAAAKALMTETSERTQAMFGVKDVQDFMALSTTMAQPALEKAVAYSRNVYSIASGASAEFSKIFETQIAEGNKRVVDMVDLATKNAPAGSEPAVSMIKSAVAAANTAYDTFSKATKQAANVVESNVAAATSATMKAAANAGEAVHAKARKA